MYGKTVGKIYINTVILKPTPVINQGKIYQDYVISYKYPDNFRHLLVWKEDKKSADTTLPEKREKTKLVLYYILL
jgi:hypothetical protein